MKSYNPEGFGARISEEMERAGIKDVRTLHQKVSALTSERGTSYTAVFQYAKGTWPTEPRRPVVEALARVLNGVRPEYLLFDGEIRTEEQIRAAAATDRAMPHQPGLDREAILAAFREEGGPVTHTIGAGSHERLVPMMVVQFGLRNLPERAGETFEMAAARHIDTARMIGRAVRAPLDTLDLHPERWPMPSRAHYLMQVLGAMWGLEELEFYDVYTLRSREDDTGEEPDEPEGED
jgi:hypothetical protein